MKKATREILIKQQSKTNPDGINPISTVVKAKNLIDDSPENSTPMHEVLGALVLCETVMKDLMAHIDSLTEQLNAMSETDLCAQLIKEGVLNPGETPIISVVDKRGVKTSKIVCSTTKQSLNIDALKEAAKDPGVFASLPKELKKEGLETSSRIFSLLKAGKIDDMYKPYLVVEDTTKTVFKTTKV